MFQIFAVFVLVALSHACSSPIILTEQVERDGKDGPEQQMAISGSGSTFLKNLKSEIAVVTLVGRARSGKSFTSNMLLQIDQMTGFRVAHGLVGETTGAQTWCDPRDNILSKMVRSALINATNSTPPLVVLVDTEGVNLGSQHNDGVTMLYAVATSNIVIYHVSEQVNADDIKRLGAIKEFIDHMYTRGVLDPPSSKTPHKTTVRRGIKLPALFWVVQKFSQVLPNGVYASADKLPARENVDELINSSFLHEEMNSANDINIASHNETVKTILQAFSVQHAFVAPTAETERTGHASKLPQAPIDSLSPAYVRAINELRDAIVQHIVNEHLYAARPLTWYSSKGGWANGPDYLKIAGNSLYAAASGGSSFMANAVVEHIAREMLKSSETYIDTVFEHAIVPVSDANLMKYYEDIMASSRGALDGNISRSLIATTRETILRTFSEYSTNALAMLKTRNAKAQDDLSNTALNAAIAVLNTDCTRKDKYGSCKFSSSDAFEQVASKSFALFSNMMPFECFIANRARDSLTQIVAAKRSAVNAALIPATEFTYVRVFLMYSFALSIVTVMSKIYSITTGFHFLQWIARMSGIFAIIFGLLVTLFGLSGIDYLWDPVDGYVVWITELSMVKSLASLVPFYAVVGGTVLLLIVASLKFSSFLNTYVSFVKPDKPLPIAEPVAPVLEASRESVLPSVIEQRPIRSIAETD